MKSYTIDLSDAPVFADPYSILATVSNVYEQGDAIDFWVVAATEVGFVGIPVGKEEQTDMSALPGQLWHDVLQVGSTEDTGQFSAQTLMFEKVHSLFQQHNG